MIITLSVLNPYAGVEEIVDFSKVHDQLILGYYVKDIDNKYILHFQNDGLIMANFNASYYFSNNNGVTYGD